MLNMVALAVAADSSRNRGTWRVNENLTTVMLQGAEDERSREGVALHFSSFFSLCVAVAARPEWFVFLYSSFFSSVYTTSSVVMQFGRMPSLVYRTAVDLLEH
jgi:hypothetical protein